MLRRADNCKVLYSKRFLGSGKLFLQVGSATYLLRKCPQVEVDQITRSQMDRPFRLRAIGERTYWRFQNRTYWDNDGLSSDQVYALLVTRLQREQATVERAQAMVANGLQPQQSKRGGVPDDVKQMVWLRDGGKCQSCGSTVELQFDHVIPVALGGSDSPDNLQVLCGPCNRAKGAGITAGTRSPAIYLPPAGWYDDPQGIGQVRYWDGSNWTGNIQ